MTEAGLYGCPSDYGPDYVSLDEVRGGVFTLEFHTRSAVVTALIELAHDLDARGLVLVSEDELDHIFSKGWGAGFDFTNEHPEPPSSPNTGS